jgi:hypothetical protein
MGLSDEEMATVSAAAAPLQPHQRAPFLEAVATALSKGP